MWSIYQKISAIINYDDNVVLTRNLPKVKL